MSQVGLRDLHIAILTEDTADLVSYEAPQSIVGAINATINPTVNTQELFADDQLWESVSALGKIDVEVETAELPLETQGLLSGHTVTNGVLVEKADTLAPHVALGFRSLKSNGGWRYVWLLKGVPQPMAEDYATRTDNVEHKTPKMRFTFMPRIHDAEWKHTADYDEAVEGEAWFTAVPVSGAAPTGGE